MLSKQSPGPRSIPVSARAPFKVGIPMIIMITVIIARGLDERITGCILLKCDGVMYDVLVVQNTRTRHQNQLRFDSTPETPLTSRATSAACFPSPIPIRIHADLSPFTPRTARLIVPKDNNLVVSVVTVSLLYIPSAYGIALKSRFPSYRLRAFEIRSHDSSRGVSSDPPRALYGRTLYTRARSNAHVTQVLQRRRRQRHKVDNFKVPLCTYELPSYPTQDETSSKGSRDTGIDSEMRASVDEAGGYNSSGPSEVAFHM
ncbi:hypothetical protein T265_01228 [Opisthorchis viverrini]|uniref:Uncharacterized protein n=1 Tax=Opisthorchis viverrini TaxID=6198 RepID=A0A075AAF3_OPIVI|nr:hypothetical protein T265_01228 [Opisthorchis viverrini]KER32740.1 hypothetical protein T265_01228 [Opisthorchis viverrini]